MEAEKIPPKNLQDNPGRLRETLGLALKMPWTMGYELRRWVAYPYIRLMFALHGIRWGKRWRIWGMPIIQRFSGSEIMLGAGLNLRSWSSTNPLTPCHPVVFATRSASAQILIGEDVGMTGATVVAAERIEIGQRVLVGANAVIVDTDFHPMDPFERRISMFPGATRPTIIGNDVFIGMNAIILKGAVIGAEAVIGAGSVVTGEVPPRTIFAGNPARLVRNLETEQ